jgi:hypothetical protein
MDRRMPNFSPFSVRFWNWSEVLSDESVGEINSWEVRDLEAQIVKPDVEELAWD